MTAKKRGRGRPKGAPNKPKMELITEKKELFKNSDAFEIFCQADLVAQENETFAINGLMVYGQSNGALQDILQWVFNDRIKSTLPEGKTPYKVNDAPASDLSESALRFEFKKFKYFCTEEVPKARRETMWIEMLESIPAKEAEMMDLVKDKVWPFKHITKEIASKAFPNANIG